MPFRQFLKVSGLRSYSPQNPQTLISLRFQLATILLSEPKNCDFSQGSYLRLDIKGQGLVICDWTSKGSYLRLDIKGRECSYLRLDIKGTTQTVRWEMWYVP